MSIKNIVIDQGNSSTKVGVFNDTELTQTFEVAQLGNVLEIIKSEKPQFILISSVVNELELKEKLSELTQVIQLTDKTPLPFINDYQTPETLGPDRIAAVAGALFEFPKQNCLVIDAGTCITYDFINSDGRYLGGAISPGLRMRAKALNSFTSKLPLVEVNANVKVIGDSTQSCIESGVSNGLLMEIEGMIEHYRRTFGEIKVLICGGDSNFFESKLKGHIFAVANLVLLGLNRILLYNIESFEENN